MKAKITIHKDPPVFPDVHNTRPPPPVAMAIRLSPEECAHIDMLRTRSYELAVERGHINRWQRG